MDKKRYDEANKNYKEKHGKELPKPKSLQDKWSEAFVEKKKKADK